MALATVLLPSDGKARHLKYMSLLVDGGTIVLRHQLETLIQPADLASHLKTKPAKIKIKQLVHKGVISNDQKKAMQNGQADISRLDVSLLVCLLRNVCGLDETLPIWNPKYPPGPTDSSVEADIARLRNLRNTHAHSASTSLTEKEFEHIWTELKEILQRLGATIPDLQQTIAELKTKSIDPAKEQELLEEIDAWETMDQSLISVVEQMKSELGNQSTEIKGLSSDVSKIQKDQSVNQQKTNELEKNVEELQKSHKNLKRDVAGVQKGQQKQMSSQLQSLFSMSKICMDKYMADTTYVKTGLHRDAEKKLKQERLLVLSGLPGEGKTTMSHKLAAEIADPGRCLILRDPGDCTHVVLSSSDVQTLVIDDIFGAGVLDQRIAEQWQIFLPQICTVVEEKGLFLIVTTRQYILEEAKTCLRQLPLFNEEHVLTLSSARLDKYEMEEILAAHMRNKGKPIEQVWFDDCINSGQPFFSVLGKSIDFVFGFPQCVEMFVSNEQLFNKGAEFFSKPNAFFRQCIEDLKRDEKKMFALILIWSRNGKPLMRSELAIDGSISKELQTIASKFGFKLRPKFVKLLRQSVDHHADGFVKVNSRQGTYRLSHHVVEDMIGLVASKDYPEAVLEYCSRDFLLEYVTIDKSNDDKYHFFVDTSMYRHLSDKLLTLILTPPPSDCKVNVKRFKNNGKCSNRVIPTNELDSELVLRPFFKNTEFVQDFVILLQEEESVERTITLLSTPVLKMSGHFLKHGVVLDETPVYLAQFSLLHEYDILPREIVRQRVVEFDKGIELSLLLAVHFSLNNMVECLLKAGAAVTEDAIYIAAVKESTDVITMLMKHKKPGVCDSRVCNGSSALLVSVKKGLTRSVRCLLDNGVDVNHRNKDGYCALDKAIAYKHVEISKLLIDAGGSPLNIKRGKLTRTPLHVASNIGWTEVVSHILSKEESSSMLKTKDHRGHYPLHCAAIRGHIDTVKLILEHDKSLATQWIVGYRKTSPFIGGMTVFHIAVWTKNLDMMKMLVNMGLGANAPDKFGRTPLYCAAYEGDVDLVKTLLLIADVQQSEKQGFTPLHAAIHRRHLEVAKLLCPLSDVNAADKLGRTPLHVACQKGLIDSVNLLLNEGADCRMITNKGMSCTEIAYWKYHCYHAENHKELLFFFLHQCRPLDSRRFIVTEVPDSDLTEITRLNV